MSDTAATAPTTPAPAAASAEATKVDTPASSQVTKPAATEAPKTVTINGKTYSEADVLAAMGKADTVAQGLKQLAAERKALEEARGTFKDPKKLRNFLKENGYDPEKFAEETIVEAMEQEQLTPEQRELAQLRAEKAEREAAAKAESEKKAKAEQEKQVDQLVRTYENQFIEAMTSQGLPRTAQTVMQLTEIVKDGIEAGFDVSPAEAAQILRTQMLEGNKPLYKGMSVSVLKEALGQDVIDAIIKDHQESLKAVETKAPDAKAEKTTSGKASARSSSKERDVQKRWSDIFGS